MIDEKTTELLIERLTRRVEQANTYFLKSIGSSIKKIRELTPTQAHELVQILKYGGNYDEIVRKIAKYTSLNINEIEDIFFDYAKKDQMFYEKFYKYRKTPFIPFEQNSVLKTQTMALSNIVRNEMYNFARTNVLGYTINGKFLNLRDTYNQLLDEAFLNVGQGKTTFDSAMAKILKDIGGSGIKTLNYQSGRSVRLDSAIRMQLKSRLGELHEENQKIIGEEIDFDGWEISVHEFPAPDHQDAQGKQFSIEEYDKLQSGLNAKDYTGKVITLDHDGKNGYRPIHELNCYHYPFTIVLGVSKPQYSEKELKEIIDRNNKGFDFDGKHYNMYEGTQLQRNLERRIREQKDIQILAKASGNEQLIGQTQKNITIYTNKYNQLSKTSGLPTKIERMKVSKYKRKDVSKYKAEKVISSNNEILKKTLKYDNIGLLLPKGATLENVKVIAGYQTSTPIKSINKLIKNNPSDKVLWQKKVGTIKGKHRNYEIHWYSNGDKEVYHKIKRVKNNES